MPLFSVVVPAYNADNYILECLDSVKRQTFSDYDVVVVDDGSHDTTGSLVEGWGNKNPEVKLQLVRQANRGIGAARNTGIRHAAGDFIAFLDADDGWLSNKLECVHTFLLDNPAIDLVCHDEWLWDETGAVRTLRYGPYTAYRDLLFKRNCVSTSATAVRREKLLVVGGFSEDLSFNSVEDYDLWLRLAKSGCRFAYLQQVLGWYRAHRHGVSKNAASHCDHTLNVLAAHFRDCPPGALGEKYCMRRRRAGAMRGAGRVLMKEGEHARAARYLGNAFREDPLSWKTWGLGILNLMHLRI